MSVLKGEGKVPILFGTSSIAVGSRTHRGYLARPDLAGQWPTVIVAADVWGVTSSVKDVCRRIAREGFSALALDVYRDEGPGRAVTQEEADTAYAALSQDRIAADLDAVARYIQNPAGFWSSAEYGFAVLGLGVGGEAAARLADRSEVRALGLVGTALDGATGDLLSRVSAPILGIYARDDDVVKLDDVIAERHRMPHAEIVVYDNVGHDFLDDSRDAYDFVSAMDALERLTGFFGSRLEPALR